MPDSAASNPDAGHAAPVVGEPALSDAGAASSRESTPAARRCGSCGADLPALARFCMFCAAPQVTDDTPPEVRSGEPEPPSPPDPVPSLSPDIIERIQRAQIETDSIGRSLESLPLHKPGRRPSPPRPA